MQEKIEVNDKYKILLDLLNDLLPSINSIDKELRREQIRQTQSTLEQLELVINEEILQFLNINLIPKNLQLTKNLNGNLVVLDRQTAYEKTYAKRFAYFLENTNEKTKEIEILEQFVVSLFDLNVFKELLEKKGVIFLDIGAGDGGVSFPIVKRINTSGNINYVGIERDKNLLPLIKEKFDNVYPEVKGEEKGIPCTVYSGDFRDILNQLPENSSSIALISNLYTTISMNDFLPMIFKVLDENGIAILVHETGESDAVKFRAIFDGLLKNYGGADYTQTINNAFEEFSLNSITMSYDSSLRFPRLDSSDWNTLKQIKQTDYGNIYPEFSENLKTAKNLIEFVLSDKLEAFTNQERHALLDKFQNYLINNDYQFKSTCKVQVALSPNHTLECKNQFLQLKDEFENLIDQRSTIQHSTIRNFSNSFNFYQSPKERLNTPERKNKMAFN